MLLSSHILHEVEQVCTRTIIIASGRIVASGSPQELRDKFSAGGRVVAELKGPEGDIESGVRQLGVQKVQVASSDGWVRLSVDAGPGRDVREEVFKLAMQRGWTLRELRREGATLEDFFVQVTAEQQVRRSAKA